MNDKDILNNMDYLMSAALNKCGNVDDAQDLAQETALEALSYPRKGEVRNIKAFLNTVLNRRFYDMLRRKLNKPCVTISEDFEFADDSDVQGETEQSANFAAVRRETAYLAKNYRDIIVMHYFYGKSISQIAHELKIPVGTVKSRMSFGRNQMKKGLDFMEEYTQNSFVPQNLVVRNSGCCGMNEEPMSLVPDDDKLAQNLLILAYNKPVSVTDLSRAIGVSAAYVEPVVSRLVNGELMKRLGDGKIYTDFIIYHAEDHVKYIKQAEKLAEDNADAYCVPMQKAIQKLKQTDFYSLYLERYMLINIAASALWKSMEPHRKPQIFPDRPNGGKWIAFGTIYPPNYTIPENKRGREEYMLSGQRQTVVERYLDSEKLKLYNYETSLYPYPKYSYYGFSTFMEVEEYMIKLFYLIKKGIPPESVGIDERIVKAMPILERRGFISTKNGKPQLLIPCLTHLQEAEFWKICEEAAIQAANQLEAPMLEYVKTHRKQIPPHLKSVPEQKLTMPYEPSTMMLVYEAIRCGLHERDIGCPCPETFMVAD